MDETQPRPRRDYSHLSDQALVVALMHEDALLAYEDDGEVQRLEAELRYRYPGGDVDNLATAVTGFHMTGTEAVIWAATEWPTVEGWLTGRINGENWSEAVG
jgi:hypothetical protein